MRRLALIAVVAALLCACGGDYPTPGPDEEWATVVVSETVCHPEYIPIFGYPICWPEDVTRRVIVKKAH